jgi:hypothetical protein
MDNFIPAVQGILAQTVRKKIFEHGNNRNKKNSH